MNSARLVRFAVFAFCLILCGFILSKGSGTAYISRLPLEKETDGQSLAAGTGSASGEVVENNDNDISLINNKDSSNIQSTSSNANDPQKIFTDPDGYQKIKAPALNVDEGDRIKATFVTLARNSDLWSLAESIRAVEDRFNNKFHYDWVFLNDDEFSEEFKRVTTSLCSGTTKYGFIEKDQWGFPSWIDTEKAAKVRQEMKEKKIIYGDSISYRHMCRYESGFFFRHKLMEDYEWYWRVEPSIKIYCDINYDIFKFMRDNNKVYGFTISLPEYKETIPTLWETTREFTKEHPEYLPENNMLDFISDDNGNTYNGCHFWSNFEVGSLSFWRSDAYLKYFEHLDKAGGFFYERWGDAPVHSIAAALFLPRDKIHFFGDLGYYHVPFHNCPADKDIRDQNRCLCNPKDDFTWKGYSCVGKYFSVNKLKRPSGWEDLTD
ncbi:glycosyltransferase family 15 protein [Ascoidea rubescens DSM 1968]|uniref:Glycosyltransferase family 15 protein n=1 Tax=Ascoidea rubescens DSM 1968 TaxID=1344418 RepID=A0A1D2VIU4_9ASCO|nr:glycosyltransferase family 15 protein [Ascoidea rubescens DSM 1968]ODV61490.1 glycosyltransferase family 15 protein [Ascoidea rubescens DSM 1968]